MKSIRGNLQVWKQEVNKVQKEKKFMISAATDHTDESYERAG